MLQVKNEYQTPIDSIFYQNNASISNFEKPNNSQKQKDYTAQIIENSSKMNYIYI